MNSNTANTLSHDDIVLVQKLASKYNLSIPELGRTIVRLTVPNMFRYVRVSSEEYNLIVSKAKKNNQSITDFCYYACLHFVKCDENNIEFYNPHDTPLRAPKSREKRIGVAIRNRNIESKVQAIATKYNLKVSTILRYFIVQFSMITMPNINQDEANNVETIA